MRSHDATAGAGEREEAKKAMERGKAKAALSDRRDSMGEGSSDASDSSHRSEEFVCVKLEEIRKEVQCAICLGIIRKTRTVMECMHRFCRDCIDKSMRLGNNECPACRTHCASRRSLRDDPNFDALISALYPDIDKFEKEEFSFTDEEKLRNKMIQDSIAETSRRQSEVAGKRGTSKSLAVANVRRSRKRCTGSDNEERQESIEVNAARNGTPSSEEQSPPSDERPRRRKKSRQYPEARTADGRTINETENLQNSLNSSLLVAWGRNGTRSRHVNTTFGSNGTKVSRSSRLARLIQHLKNTAQENNEMCT